MGARRPLREASEQAGRLSKRARFLRGQAPPTSTPAPSDACAFLRSRPNGSHEWRNLSRCRPWKRKRRRRMRTRKRTRRKRGGSARHRTVQSSQDRPERGLAPHARPQWRRGDPGAAPARRDPPSLPTHRQPRPSGLGAAPQEGGRGPPGAFRSQKSRRVRPQSEERGPPEAPPRPARPRGQKVGDLLSARPGGIEGDEDAADEQ
eukprot:9468242-Pyramimonas_sp.AAC.5